MAQIPFTRGVPSPDLLPVDDLRAAADAALTKEPALALSYLTGAGHPGLRAWIGARHGVPAERVIASNGSLQAFLFLAELMVERSSTKRVLVEAPTYDRPLILLRRAGAEPVGIPVDEHGLDVDALEDDLRRAGAPAFLYVIPTFQNPSGTTLPLARRERLVELSHRYGFTIVEDDPYGLLRFRGETLPTIHSLDPDRVVTMSSFTKTVAPGLRIGYADRAGRPRRAPHPLRDRHLHRAGRARAVDARRLLRGRPLRAERRPCRRGARRARAHDGAGAAHALPGRHPARRARRRLLPVGRPRRETVRTRRGCSPPRPRPVCRT